MAKSARTVFQLGALVMLLIVFPAASWYYLNSGLQYRRTTMAELKDYGTFPCNNWQLVKGRPLSESFLKKKMLLTHILPDGSNPELMNRYGATLRRLHDQFEERDELIFLTLVPGDSATAIAGTEGFAEKYELNEQKQQFFVGLEGKRYSELQKTALDPKTETPVTEPTAFFLLTDTTATIRRYYDVREESDIKRLVEHIALLLPLKKDRELIFRREAEK